MQSVKSEDIVAGDVVQLVPSHRSVAFEGPGGRAPPHKTDDPEFPECVVKVLAVLRLPTTEKELPSYVVAVLT